jgi:hypothetical protein
MIKIIGSRIGLKFLAIQSKGNWRWFINLASTFENSCFPQKALGEICRGSEKCILSTNKSSMDQK